MPFLPTSRYANVATVRTTRTDGAPIRVVKLRPLGRPGSVSHTVRQGDRLDVISHERTGDATEFWRIGDANTALETAELTRDIGRSISVPEDA